MNSEFTVAVHCLVFLAYVPERLASSEVLAWNVCTNPARIRKVMNLLRKHNLVRTQSGAGGGYLLNRDPKDLTLREIYQITSSGALASEWRSGDEQMDCPIASKIGHTMSRIYQGAESRYALYLDEFTIQDLVNDMMQEDQKGSHS